LPIPAINSGSKGRRPRIASHRIQRTHGQGQSDTSAKSLTSRHTYSTLIKAHKFTATVWESAPPGQDISMHYVLVIRPHLVSPENLPHVHQMCGHIYEILNID
jgi:hypothetical protein